MPYLIGYAPKTGNAVATAGQPNARAALKAILALKASDEEIRFIRKIPSGTEITHGELQRLADREGQF